MKLLRLESVCVGNAVSARGRVLLGCNIVPLPTTQSREHAQLLFKELNNKREDRERKAAIDMVRQRRFAYC
jgi:hypothetical protein